jgi:hypothetical protein
MRELRLMLRALAGGWPAIVLLLVPLVIVALILEGR